MDLNIVNLGRMDYAEALRVQEKTFYLRQQGLTEDTLILVEHPPVLTIGTSGTFSNILMSEEYLESNGISVYNVGRGGDVTYHGPGQIVGYPIMDMKNFNRDLKGFVWKVEDVIIKLLINEYEIKAYRDERKYTGVWVNNEKITAIGMSAKKWVTMHGFAFNVNTNLAHFKWINPCGITDKGVTSLEKVLGHTLDFEEVNTKVTHYFCDTFSMKPVMLSKDEFLCQLK